MKRATLGLLMTGVVLLTSGCASETEPSSITEDDYRTGFNTFVSCMEGAGYPVQVIDDSGTVIEYAIPGTVVGTEIEIECYGPFQDIDATWQIANEDSSEGALAIRECLVEHGVEPVGTAAGDWELVVEHGLEKTC